MTSTKIQVDFELVEKLATEFNTKDDIAEILGCSVDTLDRRIKEKYGCGFAALYKKGTAKGRKSLRARMYELAMAGNVTMLIWLSKQYLGHTDKVESQQTSSEKYSPKDKKEMLNLVRETREETQYEREKFKEEVDSRGV
jgi:hypothetical protein